MSEPFGELVLMGTGTSVGVPVIGCDCDVCRSDHPRNQRTRTGVLVTAPDGQFVIDTPPELRLQLTRERADEVRAAVFTHAHADHIFGLDDLRICGFRMGAPMPLFCEEPVEETIRASFSYAFGAVEPSHRWALPKFEFDRIGEELEPFSLLGMTIRPLRLMHGKLPILGFRMRDVAFCTDVNHIPVETLPFLADLDVLILDALQTRPHATHFSLAESLEIIERLQPKRAVLTHLSHEFDYEATNASLPTNVELGFDGMKILLP